MNEDQEFTESTPLSLDELMPLFVKKIIQTIQDEIDASEDTKIHIKSTLVTTDSGSYQLFVNSPDSLDIFEEYLHTQINVHNLGRFGEPRIIIKGDALVEQQEPIIDLIYTHYDEESLSRTSGLSGNSIIINGKHEYAISSNVINIGRSNSNDLVIPDSSVSQSHLQIRISPNAFEMFDLNSMHGTYVNSKPKEYAVLQSGDVIRIGNTTMILVIEPSSGE